MPMGHVYELYFQVSCTKLSELVGYAMQVLLLFLSKIYCATMIDYLAKI
jgi:hypothetical protein